MFKDSHSSSGQLLSQIVVGVVEPEEAWGSEKILEVATGVLIAAVLHHFTIDKLWALSARIVQLVQVNV